MDNASALPTCAQQQQQQKLLLIIIDQKLPTRLRDEAKFTTAVSVPPATLHWRAIY
jgi:hypothetical protein